ncbi:MAG: DUF3237 family protein [Lachnospiraceae bacterium]|nr:DUF3237 family protein [Lachnospiraceae bacterium]
MEEVLAIHVILDQIQSVLGAAGQVVMIRFHGTFTCSLGTGKVLPGGVDTQIERPGQERTLSARYILEGQDRENRTFHIFVENNGVCGENGVITTTHVIFTDAKELQWMEREKLTGIVESDGEDGVMIKICRGMNG